MEGVDSPCRLYEERYLDRSGYGREKYRGRELKAHVLAYQLDRGLDSIPSGFELHHVCRVRRCIAIDHLQLLPREEHRRLLKERCRNGHRYPANPRLGSRGYRRCVECERRRSAAARRRKAGLRAEPLPPLEYQSLSGSRGAAALADLFYCLCKEHFPGDYVRRPAGKQVGLAGEWLRDLDAREVEEVFRTVVEDWAGDQGLLFELHDQGALRTNWSDDFAAPKLPTLIFLTTHERMEITVNWYYQRLQSREKDEIKRQRSAVARLAKEDLESLVEASDYERVWQVAVAQHHDRFARRFRKRQADRVQRLRDALMDRYPDGRLLAVALAEAATQWSALHDFVLSRLVAPHEQHGLPEHPDIDWVLDHFPLVLDWLWETAAPEARGLVGTLLYPPRGLAGADLEVLIEEARTLQEYERLWQEAVIRSEGGCVLPWTGDERRLVKRMAGEITKETGHPGVVAVVLVTAAVRWPILAEELARDADQAWNSLRRLVTSKPDLQLLARDPGLALHFCRGEYRRAKASLGSDKNSQVPDSLAPSQLSGAASSPAPPR